MVWRQVSHEDAIALHLCGVRVEMGCKNIRTGIIYWGSVLVALEEFEPLTVIDYVYRVQVDADDKEVT